jgi:serine/threonine-protein kinase
MTCPDTAKLRLLLNEQLPATEFAETEAHVEDCPSCQTQLQWLLTEADRPEPALGPENRYRILHLHAQGGLGEVFVAQDMELNREVALKRMQARCQNDPGSRRRFLQETEITARLEHPGVVPVYGLVQDSGGYPCYAMRFIRGESLEEAIRRFHEADRAGRDSGATLRVPGLALRHLLSRFVAVCNAVAYAHSRGILHRDLKPGNVMLGPYGETLVVDWGLAKLMARDDTVQASGEPTLIPGTASGDSATRTGQAMGTPAYMSPEQASGQWGQVGPASDIYSLGAILYKLLTGQPPFAGAAVQEKLEKVKRGEFPPPRTVKPCPRALEAVCLKAMALRPEERYPTALALAADVEHWLADEPVGAWPEPWRVRAWRWVKRHPSWVTGSVAAVLLAAVVTAALGLVQAAREREKQESARARENYQLALDTSDKLVDLAQSLKTVSGTRIGSLERLLTLADKNYGQMLTQARGELALLERTGRLLNALSELYLDLGDTSKALERGRQARAIFEDLLKQDAAPVAWQRGLALSLERMSRASWLQGDAVEALDSARQALALRQRMARPASESVESQGELAQLHNWIGVMLEEQKDYPGALKAYQESFTIAQALVRKDSRNPQARHRLGVSLRKIAKSHYWRKLEDLPGALNHYEQAVAVYRHLRQDDPHNTEWQVHLMDALGWVGDVQQQQGDLPKARKCYEEALAIAVRLAELDPDNESRQTDVLSAREMLAEMKKLANPVQASRERLAIQRENHAIHERRVKKDPFNADFRGPSSLRE